jgi:alpha-methylacyl-CoA racemase
VWTAPRPSGLGELADGPPQFDVNVVRNRRSVALDLKPQPPPALDLKPRCAALVDGADVLIEGFRPGVAERLGLGPADCHARNPRWSTAA